MTKQSLALQFSGEIASRLLFHFDIHKQVRNDAERRLSWLLNTKCPMDITVLSVNFTKISAC